MSSVLDMFRTRTKEGELKKSVLKVSDPKKDALTRFKHLRIVLDNYSKLEAKDFFEANYSHIYFIFNDNFSNVEADLKQRANRAHREDLDAILFVFEKILTLLPELIHKRWMFHSIGRILKKLLHPGNGLKIRKDGIRLFLLWYQILNENASEECHEIFLQLVPGLGKGIHQEVLYGKSQSGAESKESCSGIIISGDITPILPGSGEKLPDNITKHYFDALIYYMVSEVIKVEWKNKRMRETCFVFLFDNFKSSYLMWLLPTFDKAGDIYNPRLDLPESRQVSELESHDMPGNVSDCRYSFIKWLAHFVFISKQHDKAIENQVPETVGSEEDITENQPMVAAAENMPGSNASTLSTGSHHSELDSMTSSLCYEEWVDENDIVRSVLLTSRENINIIHESFRQAFLFSLNQSKSIKTVISVYKDWFQHADQKPIFMQEPSDIGLGHAPDHHSSLSDILEEDSSDESAPQTKDLSKSLPSLDSINNSRIRNASYLGAIGDLADGGRLNDVRAGIQKVLQVFIVNSANVFLLQTDDESAMSEQVDLCKKVINIYRYLVMNINMEQKTWEKMLQVLLCITTGVLGDVPIFNRKPTDLQKRLATPIFQTIIVTWIRANLCVFVSGQLWDQFLGVLSSLSGWPELIRQWANTMDTLTRVLAKQVYGLDLTDLPLQRLTEQKEKRRRGKSQEIPRNKSNDKSFSRSWSKNEPPNDKAFTSNAVPFERGKYKSDGAGGSKSRPDLNKQRSLSGEPSPSHSRQPSNASDSALYIRSNSDGNLADPKDLVERLKGVTSEEMREKHDSTVIPACTVSISSTSENIDSPAPEDLEVAKLSMRDLQSDPDVDSISFEHSEQDTSYRCTDSRSPSPTSIHSRSPSPISELTVHPQQKDCPTPDRDSLHIEMAATTTDGGIETKECTNDMRSVLAGGSVQGWLPDNAVVLWKRMLGILGDVNQITDPENHVMVYEELSKILDTLHKIRNNLGVTEDNTFSPPPPDFIPPTTIFTPWEFECLNLPDDYKRGKLLAYQLLCQTVVKRHDVLLSTELLSQFYMCLHTGIGTRDQEIINVLVKHCGPRFFSTPLQSSTLLLKNFIQAVEIVLSSSDLRQTPRSEALSLIGSLMCFPNHYQDLQVLNVGQLSVESLSSNTLKECIISQLLNSAKKESAETARCIALSSIGVYLYEELCHQTLHSKLHEAVIVLLGNLRCKHKVAAKTATAILSMLCDHTDQLLNYHAALPKHIIEVVTATVSVLIPLTGIEVSQEERKLIVAMLFCVVEWCMKMPISLLLETTDTDRSCVFKVFQVLDVAVKGHSTESLSQARQLLAGMIQDSDFAHLRELHSPVGDYKSDRKSGESDSIQCAAKLLINHMVNHMCHFPMGSGASRLSSSIQEHHDMEELEVNDLKQEIFYSSNIQFFVQNKRTLVSFIELPALVDLPGGGVTAGLTTARTVCRVLLRDLTGKYAWESSMLYAPPWCQEGSSIKNAKALLDLSSGSELEPLLSHDEHDVPLMDTERPSSMMPLYNLSLPHQDNLNDMLRYIGHTSPECHLIPGEPLNLEAGTPEGFSTECEEAIKGMVIHQKVNELQYYSKHKMDQGSLGFQKMLAKPQVPCEGEETTPPFQMCRMMLDQLGLLAWEQRCHFDLLRKSDKLLRELKNLDNQKCRETHKFAVIYVAEGQEDKNSILSNCGASKAFEDFVAGLGWEVDLETHQGFLGGLQQNRTTGNTAPYYATSLTECIFHVSTRMPSGTDDAMHIKMRHLGNDEIHIIWSEHTRDYRRGIIPTEFGDVLIIIYPLPSGLYRIEINKKAEVPYFGPLFDGAILDRKVLPGLVRATAINASRVKRSLLPFYHSFYEERAKNFETVIQQHVDFTMFEDFAANVFAPVLPQNATIMDQSQDLSFTASMTSVDQSQSSAVDQVSPAMPRQSRAGSSDTGIFERTAKRLSLNRRKASKTSQHQTPPESPEARSKKS